MADDLPILGYSRSACPSPKKILEYMILNMPMLFCTYSLMLSNRDFVLEGFCPRGVLF